MIRSTKLHYVAFSQVLLLLLCVLFPSSFFSSLRSGDVCLIRRKLNFFFFSFRKTAKKVTPVNRPRASNDPEGDAFAARARDEQRNIHMKVEKETSERSWGNCFLFQHRNIKIDEQLQKVKTREFVYEWKEDYRSSQQQLRRKRLIKGKDYQEPIDQAPFGIDPNYIPVMNKDQQAMVEKAVRYESRRNRSPESAMQEEEERWAARFIATRLIFLFRRIRDRQVQERIREITGKMLQRRTQARGNVFEEKRLAELELREVTTHRCARSTRLACLLF